jgi:NADH:ubiquinone oxidoreductase subunit F (NADH-binding)
MADAAGRIASGRSEPDDMVRLQRWTHLVPGRGACRHPDGAAGFLRSALLTFEEEFAEHHHHRRCRDAASTLAQVA